MECKNILVIDDDPGVRECVVDVLNLEGYHVYSAIHGKDAIEQLEKMSPESLPGCIFLDLKMPVMDGRTFLSNIESKFPNSLARIPIVVVSANGNLQNIDLRPAVEKLDKPMDIDEIYRLAHQYCGRPEASLLH
ncbi:MAG TPA: response regulator [Bacteriovoracaceae bacterium]|nr:response regulator [Bacteriovoracaceae bacterium]